MHEKCTTLNLSAVLFPYSGRPDIQVLTFVVYFCEVQASTNTVYVKVVRHNLNVAIFENGDLQFFIHNV